MPTPSMSARRTTAGLVAVLVALTTASLAELPAGSAASEPSDSGVVHISAEEMVDHGLRVDDRRMSVYAAAPERVGTGTGFVVGGNVTLTRSPKTKPAVVRLLQLTGKRWLVKQKQTTTKQGDYRFDVPGYTGAQVLTLRVRATTGRINRDSPPVQVQVVDASTGPTAGLSGLGDPTDYTRVSGPGWRWNPCQPITWRYNAGKGYSKALGHVQEAFARISLHTGFTFEYVGASTHVPFSGEETPTDADIFVSWATPQQSRFLEGGVVGVAAPGGAGTGSGTGEFLTGAVLLDSSQVNQLAAGYATQGRSTWGQVMVHEILHVMGLGHAKAFVQLMAPYITPQNHLFGAGDLAGMKAIGAEQGCVIDSRR